MGHSKRTKINNVNSALLYRGGSSQDGKSSLFKEFLLKISRRSFNQRFNVNLYTTFPGERSRAAYVIVHKRACIAVESREGIGLREASSNGILFGKPQYLTFVLFRIIIIITTDIFKVA